MAYQYADYSGRSERLIAAGQQLIQSLEDETVDRSIAIQDIESAAQASTTSELVLRFAATTSDAGPQPAETISAEDAFSGVLLDLQAANVLLSAGIALNEHGGGSDRSFLNTSLGEAKSSLATVTVDLEARAKLEFAPKANVKSVSLEAAKKTFRDNADGVLKDIVDDANAVVNNILEKLKKFESAKIMEGINNLGESVQFVAAAGRLIRRGLDMLKNALDALSKLFGKELLANTKDKAAEIWKKFQSGEYTRDVLTRMFDVKGTQARIEAVLCQADLDVGVIDSATNDLPGLSEKYKSNIKLLGSMMSAVAMAGSIIAFLHVAAPWIPLALAGVYAALIAATILVGMDYSDSGRVLRWARGVGEIANGIKPLAKP